MRPRPRLLSCSLAIVVASACALRAEPARAQEAPPAGADVPPPSSEPSPPEPAPAGAPSAPNKDATPTPDPEPPKVIEQSPMPPIRTNPVDILPPDVVYPPLVSVQPKPVEWRREWARFSTTDWIITAAAASVTLATAIIPPQRKHVYGGWLFDDDVRDALRLRDPQARFTARDISDVILSLEATWPFFVDALITTWWFRGSPDAAAQMALVDAEALAIVTAIQGTTNTLVSRERPYGQVCGTPEQPNETNNCEGNVRHRSFFSGHSAFSFMSAGLICTHHVQLGLLRGAGDALACITAYTGAAATATLRVMGDMHYATDVLTGAVVGTTVGVLVPLLHYRNVNVANEIKKGNRAPDKVDVTLIPVGAGLGIGGTF